MSSLLSGIPHCALTNRNRSCSHLRSVSSFDHFHSLLAEYPTLANATNEQGVSAILLTVYHRRHSFTRELIEARDAVGLFEAAALGDAARRLLELTSTDPQAVNRFSPDCFQPLGLPAFFGHTEAALYLIEHGADPNSPPQPATACGSRPPSLDVGPM